MRRLSVLSAMVVVILGAGTASADTSMTIGDRGTIMVNDRRTAYATVTVSCPPAGDATSTQGTTTVTVEQESRGGTVSGSGSSTVTCDNTAHTYTIAVTAATGSFSRGPARASGTTAFPYQMCIENSSGNRECTTFTMMMRVDPQPIELVFAAPNRG